MSEPETAHKPAWSGTTYVIGAETHILPLYEDDRVHNLSGEECKCQPTSVVLWEETNLQRRVYTHYTTIRAVIDQ